MSNPSGSPEDKSEEPSRGVKEVPVPPFQGGVGLPYAPEDWPNRGDTWTWKVGRRFNSTGYYTDRFLYPPKSLYNPDTPKQFASRLAIERYISSQFPHADVNAFFSSFSWKVPSTLWHSAEGKDISPLEKVEEEGRESSIKESHSGTKMKRKHTASTSLAGRRSRQSLKQSVPITIKDTGGDSPSEHMTENFNSFLDTLVDNLAQPLPKGSMAYSQPTNSLAQEDELFESQSLDNMGKVSSLREEYNKVTDEITLLETRINSNLLAVQEIDNQIAQLQSSREKLARTIESKKNLKARMTIDQQKMANAIRRIMQEGEVHQSNSKKLE